MPNFILGGERSDDSGSQTGQQQLTGTAGLVDQSECEEQHLSLSLTNREYCYHSLVSLWQTIEQNDNHSVSEGRSPSCSTGIAECETPKEGGKEQQEKRLDEAAERQLEEWHRGGRRPLQVTPESLFLAEKLQRLADATRGVAQCLLSPDASPSITAAAGGSEALDGAVDAESCSGGREEKLIRHKLLVLNDIVTELSQYRLSPQAVDLSERLMEESTESHCLRNESAVTSDSARVETTNDEGDYTEQERNRSACPSCLVENAHSTLPHTTEGFTTCSSSICAADNDLVNARVRTEQDSERVEVSSTTQADDLSWSQHMPGEVATDETGVSPFQQQFQVDSASSHLDVSTSDLLSHELQFIADCGKEQICEMAFAGQQSHQVFSQPDRIEGLMATAQNLLTHSFVRIVLTLEETNTPGNAVDDQEMPWQILQSDVVTSAVSPSGQGPQTDASNSHFDANGSDLLPQELSFSKCHSKDTLCEESSTAVRSQQGISESDRLDRMITTVQSLLRLQVMRHAPVQKK